ncbi:stage II sporulation protein P [Paenibacillus endoradicis]|uniref:stage II sporulation protein P n=1 Tax=Paenibacillus endoradicis TaxID=2972487 RepID=UPI0021595351|nr:stage II sporulation protein P [Paenibacillus endoradicis]MCR8659195.1 stage II sporulation protein P [Paenibacillus endoradicis]
MERRMTIPHNEQDWNELNEIWKFAKRFLIMVLVTMVAVVVIGAGALIRVNLADTNTTTESGLTLQVENKYVQGMLAEELPIYASYQPTQSFSMSQLGIWLFKQITGVSKTNTNVAAIDNSLDQQQMNDLLDEWNEPKDGVDSNGIVPVEPTAKPSDVTSVKGDDSVVFIYHTHNRESWNSEIQEGESNASSKSKNITLVGKRIAQQLEDKGIGAMVSDTDYPTVIPNYEWSYSYKYSKKTVKEAIASNDNLKYFFDIHRDSQARKYTTAEIDGVSYAQVFFIIGQRNTNWKENEAFAKKINEKIEEKYPGLSRGILGKTAATGNAEYNQSLAEQNVLIEVGGIENTLEESYRTADVLAEIISEIYEESKK